MWGVFGAFGHVWRLLKIFDFPGGGQKNFRSEVRPNLGQKISGQIGGGKTYLEKLRLNFRITFFCRPKKKFFFPKTDFFVKNRLFSTKKF